jgi:hypothetical protein
MAAAFLPKSNSGERAHTENPVLVFEQSAGAPDLRNWITASFAGAGFMTSKAE